jgi:hypothetical protein
MAGTNEYLSEWRKADPIQVEGTPEEAAETTALRIEAEYDLERIKALIDNNGREA